MRADLILVKGNPLEDIRALANLRRGSGTASCSTLQSSAASRTFLRTKNNSSLFPKKDLTGFFDSTSSRAALRLLMPFY